MATSADWIYAYIVGKSEGPNHMQTYFTDGPWLAFSAQFHARNKKQI